MRHTIPLLGFTITLGKTGEFCELIDSYLSKQRAFHIITANPEILLTSQVDLVFKKILQNADLITADGFGIILLAKIKGLSVNANERLTGVDLTKILLLKSIEYNLSVVIHLPTNAYSIPTKIAQAVRQNYPGADIKLVIESDKSLPEIIRHQPIILLSALGAPQQEIWINQNIKKIPSLKIAVGVGGTFDFISGKIKRAPILLRKIGLEWLWRLSREPKRIRRIVRAIIKFPYIVIMSKD